MVAVRVIDHVKTSSTYEDGEVIYKLIESPLRAGQDVTLSFEGIKSVPSAFINSALVRLVEVLPLDAIKQHLKITNSTRQINALIKQRFGFAAQGVTTE